MSVLADGLLGVRREPAAGETAESPSDDLAERPAADLEGYRLEILDDILDDRFSAGS